MATHIYIHRPSAIRAWGLTYRQRLRRLFAGDSRVRLVDSPTELPDAARLLVLDGQCLLDSRILQRLITAEEGIYEISHSAGDKTPANQAVQPGAAAAVITHAGNCAAAEAWIGQRQTAHEALSRHSLQRLVTAVEETLRKVDPPQILALNAQQRRATENALYGSAYKSVTDFITKWVWPRPARAVTRWCAALGIRPNWVTAVGIVLMLAAGLLFYQGQYGWGLLAGWVMTFLDTVDGKLARVTLTASRLGNVLDHGMDLIHPPFWYWLWGLGLIHGGGWQISGLSLETGYWLIFIGYIGGRLAEGFFEWFLASFSLFTWRPFDSFNRLITARRNPCMILLTGGWLAGRPDVGLLLVIGWTVLSTLILWWRNLLAALNGRQRLESWLKQANQGQAFPPLALHAFAPHLLRRNEAPPDEPKTR